MATAPGRYINVRGCSELAEWRRKHSIKASDLAVLLDVSVHTVHQWLSGYGRPRGIDRLAVKELCGIKTEHWWTESEQAQLEVKLARIHEVKALKPVPVDYRQRIASALDS